MTIPVSRLMSFSIFCAIWCDSSIRVRQKVTVPHYVHYVKCVSGLHFVNFVFFLLFELLHNCSGTRGMGLLFALAY